MEYQIFLLKRTKSESSLQNVQNCNLKMTQNKQVFKTNYDLVSFQQDKALGTSSHVHLHFHMAIRKFTQIIKGFPLVIAYTE
jgi:hypothetical protein